MITLHLPTSLTPSRCVDHPFGASHLTLHCSTLSAAKPSSLLYPLLDAEPFLAGTRASVRGVDKSVRCIAADVACVGSWVAEWRSDPTERTGLCHPYDGQGASVTRGVWLTP
ncbi:unspecified product [Leishmania tarentolae]|uniref:Unspecified product n=1 Tax=Leishmania tarentolae TaxID=5689 RepID=A0A640KL63_LEITA|nr:unspecified product [Leishmania tarentolae]